MSAGFSTHVVTNQPSPLVDYNLFAGNEALRAALALHAPGLDPAALHALGAQLGSADMQTHARLANHHTPQLRSHDRFGHRTDSVEFHPSYHALMACAVGAGLHGAPWRGTPGDGHHVERAAGFMLFTELEPSVLCPISMTYAVTPALRGNAQIYRDWAGGLTSRDYDPAPVTVVPRTRPGLTMGMGMTEKQGGSDVRANTDAGTDRWAGRLGRALPRSPATSGSCRRRCVMPS
jgi:putative acyl-CoA dehydrogenase